jgi:hypothetical protein
VKISFKTLVLVCLCVVQAAQGGEAAQRDRALDVIGRTTMLQGLVGQLVTDSALELPAPFTSLEAVAGVRGCNLDEALEGQQFRFTCEYDVTVGRQLPGCTGTPCAIGTLTEHLWFEGGDTGLTFVRAAQGGLKPPAEDLPPPPGTLVDALHDSIGAVVSSRSGSLQDAFARAMVSSADIESSPLLSVTQRNLFHAMSSDLLASMQLPADEVVDCGSTVDAGVLCLPNRKNIDQKGMYVCNENDYPVWFAWGRKATSAGHPNDWRSKGWDEIEPKECERIERSLSDDEDRDDYYWYASSYRYGDPETFDEQSVAEVTWSGDGQPLCIRVDAVSFNLAQPQPPCPPSGRESKWLEREFVKADRKGMKYLLINLRPISPKMR